jgi:hypothetical protein
MTMKDRTGFTAVSRRDAIRLIAVTPASGAALAGAYPLAAAADIAAPHANAAGAAPNAAKLTRPHGPSLSELGAEHFEPLIGEQFTIGGHAATLGEVRRGPKSGARFRQQFALTFTAAPHPPIEADMLPLSHPAIGRHDLHVTRRNGKAGAELEICFS